MSVYPRVGGRLIRPTMGMMRAAAGLFHAHAKVGELLPLERVLCAAFHKEPDRVPVTHFLLGAARRLTGISYERFSRDPEAAAEAYIAANQLIGGDVLYTVIDLSVEAADFGQEMVYPPYSTAYPDYRRPRIATVDDYERLEPFDPRSTPRMGMCIKLGRILSRKAGIRYPVMGFIFGPLGVLSMMRGAQRLFVDCVRHPEKVKAALEVITEVLTDYARALCDTGVDAVMLDTLFASQSGISRELWVEMEGVYVRRIAEEIRRNGALVALHNCGTRPYLDLQLEYIEPLMVSLADLPDDCESLAELKVNYGKRTAIAGLIPTQSILMEPPARIMELAREQIRALAPGGGYVLAPACEYPPNIELVNALAVVRAAEIYGKYPIK
ncbi:MAG: uroporphyrinogen decarboxylase [Actinobacteria bacterium]|nr:uroporphyrinogen decarboxylase [Actinomycetota bacterium]MDI6831919.1 uroporphyrinogen decarboxylase family protein [Actinomycetota bacterium]